MAIGRVRGVRAVSEDRKRKRGAWKTRAARGVTHLEKGAAVVARKEVKALIGVARGDVRRRHRHCHLAALRPT
jgi:hypothetical protein